MSMAVYTGGCQCCAVRYEVDAEIDSAMSCNCSRCQNLGWLLTFVEPGKFRLTRGADATTEFTFNKHVINHRFCSTCGIESFADGVTPRGPKVAINVRCLDGIDLARLTISKVDGRNF